MRKATYIVGLILVLVLGCNTGAEYEFWDISKFNLKSDAIENGAEIKILYSSNGPGTGIDFAYYIHLIAVSVETRDTINILSIGNPGINKSDENKVYNYMSDSHPALLTLTEKFNALDPLEQPKKIARDPKFDRIADNSFPTVIGSIVTIRTVKSEK